MTRRLLALLSAWLVVIILLCSCQVKSVTFDDVKGEFLEFSSSNDVAFVLDNQVLFFNDYVLDLGDQFVEKDVRFYSVNLLNKKIFYVVSEKNGTKSSIFLYQCETDGGSPQKLFEQSEVTSIKVTSSNESVLIRYKKNGEFVTEHYSYLTHEHLTIEGEEQVTLEAQGLLTYSVNKESKAFVVNHQETQEQHIIDENFLKQTSYFESLQKFQYYPFAYSLEANRVFLIYRLKIVKTGDLFPQGYAMIIFEYDFESKQLTFKSCIYPYDCEGYDVEYFLQS